MPKRPLNDATLEPISIAQAKKHVNIESDEFDTQFDIWIRAARLHVESRTHRIIARQKWRLSFNSYPSSIPAEPAPVYLVEELKYIDAAGAEQTVDPDTYVLDLDREIIRPIYGEAFPTSRGDSGSAWADVWSGYAGTRGSPNVYYSTCPADLQAAMLLLVGHLWANRETETDLELFHNRAFELLIDPYWLPE